MVNENYSIEYPLDHSKCLEVTIMVLNKQMKSDDYDSQVNSLTSVGPNEKIEVESSNTNALTEKIIQALKFAHTAITRRIPFPQTFMVATATGFQLLRFDQIIYFEYITNKKQWILLLTDQTSLQLKRNTIAENILNYSLNFVRINQQYIINLEYLVRIEGRLCKLSISTLNEMKLIISRSYLKGLQEKIEVI